MMPIESGQRRSNIEVTVDRRGMRMPLGISLPKCARLG